MQGVGSYDDGGEIFTTADAPTPPLPTDQHIFADEKIKAPSASPEPTVNVNGEVNHDDEDEDKEADLAEDLFGDGDDDQDETVDHEAVVAAAPDAFDDEAPVDEPEGDERSRRPLDEYGNEISEEEWRKRKELEYEEREGEAEGYVEQEYVAAEVKLANLPAPLATDGKVWDLRIPNFISLESSPYTELPPEDDEPEFGARGPLPDENIVRWQWVSKEDGSLYRQSNARVVKWSDGSESLQIGSELFDMLQQVDHTAVRGPAPNPVSNDVKPENVGPTGVPSQHASSLASAPHPNFAKESHPLTYLFAQHDYARLLEAQTSIYGTITLRPTGTSSQAHRALVNRATGGVARHAGPSTPGTGAYRARKTNMIAISVDPERQKAEREAEELKKAKEAKKLAAAERRKAAGGSQRTKGRNIRKAKFHARLFSDDEGLGGEDDEEEDDEEDLEGGVSRVSRLAGERRQPKRGTGGMYADDPEEAGFVVPDDDDDEEEEDDDEDDEEGSEGEKKRKKKEKSSSAKRDAADDDAPLEDLELAEKELEAQAREAKRRKKKGAQPSSDAMDLDSGGEGAEVKEEAAPQGRRRLVIESDEEE